MFKRLCILLLALFVWHFTQTLLTTDTVAEHKIIDRIHDSNIFRAINDFMDEHQDFTRYNFILTSLLIDVNVVYICLKYLFGGNGRSMFIFFIGLIFRQLCQFINRLPTPDNMIWLHPGVPSMLVTYYVINDFFFSGHTYVAICAGLEIIAGKKYWTKLYGAFFIAYEILFVLVTKSHYAMDVYTGIATYFMMAYFYDKYVARTKTG